MLCGGWTFCSCSLPVTFCFLLVTFCFLLVDCYFLLIARYFLLVARCSVLFTCCSLLFASYFFPAFMGNCPTISHTCYSYLPSRWVLYVFVPGVTQGNEDEGWVHDFILLVFFSCKSRELGGRGCGGEGVGGRGPRFPCVNPVVESFWGLLWAIIKYWAESHLKSCQTSTGELSCKNNQQV